MIKEHSFLSPFFYISLFYMFALIVNVCRFVLNISTVARVVGELWVRAAVGGWVPYVQVHVRAERVEAWVLDRRTPPLLLSAVGGMRRGDGGHGGGSLRVEVALVGHALGRPDGSKQAGHGREAAGPREVWLWRKETKTIRAVRTLFLSSCGWFVRCPKRTKGAVSQCYIFPWLLLTSPATVLCCYQPCGRDHLTVVSRFQPKWNDLPSQVKMAS